MAEISWIKLRVDMFDDEKIKLIQSMPEGDAILVIWIRIMALAGKCNANGLVLVEDEFPYSDEMLSVIFNKPLATIRLALSTFEKFRMIEQTQKGIYITNFDKHQNSDRLEEIREQNRLRKQRERERKKSLLLGNSGDSEQEALIPENIESHENSVTCHVTTRDVTEQRENKNKNIDIYNISSNEDIVEIPQSEIPKRESNRIDYDEILRDYLSTCSDLPGIRAINDSRKKKIKTLANELEKLKIFPGLSTERKLHVIFQEAQESDFLSGRSGKWDGCSFDWLINKQNALKVIEGNYKNKGGEVNARSEAANKPNNPECDYGIDGTTNEALERFRRSQT